MALLSDLNAKRIELNTSIDDYKQAILDFQTGSIDQAALDAAKVATVALGDEYAKLTGQVNRDDPAVTNADQLFSNPSRMNAMVRDDIKTIMTTGTLFGGDLKLLIDTEGTTANATNVILSFAAGSDVQIDWGDNTSVQPYTGAASHNYATAGQYVVQVQGTVNGFTTPLTENKEQIKDVQQWGSVQFASIENMFQNRTGFVISAADGPTLLPGCSMIAMFYNATDFNSNIDHWDVSNVTDMYYMFRQASAFNQPLNNWNVSNVTSMYHMFNNAEAFNQPLNNWNVSNVTDIYMMFYNAVVFNQNISGWDVSSVTNSSNFSTNSALTSANSPF